MAITIYNLKFSIAVTGICIYWYIASPNIQWTRVWICHTWYHHHNSTFWLRISLIIRAFWTNTSTNKCEYSDCLEGYYSAGGISIAGSAPNCKACPSYAICSGGTAMPCCNVGYYLINNNYIEGIVGGTKDYDCLRCPSLGSVAGTTRDECPVYAPEPSHITRCYIPSGKNISDTAGTYQFTQNCNYSE